MAEKSYLTLKELESGLESIRQSPSTDGTLALIVRRPAVGGREVLDVGELNPVEGLVGDTWSTHPNSRTPDKSPHPDTQLTVINLRSIQLLAQEPNRWALAGDQLVVDLDLSLENLPAGTQLALGSAIIEVTTQPHTGCHKFAGRFGHEALKWVNSPAGKQLRLRGIYAKVIQPGTIRVGDPVKKL